MNDVRITLRLPEDLHNKITESAKTEERSLNGQIIFLLKKAFETVDSSSKPGRPVTKTKD